MMGIKENKLPLAKSIVDDFQDFDPAKPDAFADFKIPASPKKPAAKAAPAASVVPDGN